MARAKKTETVINVLPKWASAKAKVTTCVLDCLIGNATLLNAMCDALLP